MRSNSIIEPFFALAVLAASSSAWAREPANLLALAMFQSESAGVIEDGQALAWHLVDGHPGTTASFEVVDGKPVDLLFGFEGGTVAPDSLAVTLSSDPGHRPPARIDILVSTVSPSSGFASLRTERIDPLKPNQRFRFSSAAANWVLIRLYPEEGANKVSLGDISVGGKKGLPETIYAFGETPAAALEIVGAMRGIDAADLDLTSEETEIFALAAGGSLSHADFVTISLLASGVTDARARSDYLARIEALAREAETVLDRGAPPEVRGAQLLRWLHEHTLTGGYRERQTNLSVAMDDGVFNCVSSAVLFNAVAGRLGFDVRAIEVPDHAFSIVYDGLNHMDVETTTREGFNPLRDRVAEFEKLTGFRYIPQSNKSKRREIDAAGLAALIYYNHGVAHLEEGRYQEALFANFRAMSLDPSFASAATNALAALNRWSRRLADENRWEDATKVAAIGSQLAPQDSGLAATQKAVWQRWAFSEADAGRPESALEILSRAALTVDAKTFDGMRSAILTRPAENLIETGNWRAALAATASAEELLESDALADITDWRRAVFRRWAHAEMKSGRFDQALDVLAEGLLVYPDDRDISRAIRFLAQETAAAGGYTEGLSALRTVMDAVPEVEGIEKVTAAFVQRHVRSGLGSRQIEDVYADVERAAPLLGTKLASELGAFVYDAYGHDRIHAEDWARAAEIYAEGRAIFPESSILSRNARYVAQQWQRAANAVGGIAALEEVQRTLRVLFPEFAVDPGFGEDEIVRQINAALRKGEYPAAQAALQSAQLLIRPETYRKLHALIVDRQAQKAMKAGDWAGAASLYSAARIQMGEPSLFSNNVRYIAQEWTRTAAGRSGAAGVATVMKDLTALFPDDKDVASMGLRTLRRMITSDIDGGAFERAERTIREAASFLTQEEAGSLIVTLYVRAGRKAIDEADWPEALGAYAEGLAIMPDSRELSRNVPFVFQEWSREALREGGAARLAAEVATMQGIFPEARSLPDVLESVVGREITSHVKSGDPQSALDLIAEMALVLPEDVSVSLKVLAYDLWARGRADASDWDEAIRIYDMGLLEVPQSRLLHNNRKYAISKL